MSNDLIRVSCAAVNHSAIAVGLDRGGRQPFGGVQGRQKFLFVPSADEDVIAPLLVGIVDPVPFQRWSLLDRGGRGNVTKTASVRTSNRRIKRPLRKALVNEIVRLNHGRRVPEVDWHSEGVVELLRQYHSDTWLIESEVWSQFREVVACLLDRKGRSQQYSIDDMALSEEQKSKILALLDSGCDRKIIAERVGVTPAQVSAVAAHLTMGTYTRPSGTKRAVANSEEVSQTPPVSSLQSQVLYSDQGIVLGRDTVNGESIRWDPFPQSGSANPHVLVIGESGFGKTYLVQCLLGELAISGIPSVVLDYAQGFSLNVLPREFIEATKPTEIRASEDGIAINPLEIFPTDTYGPVSVAQRVADTFTRVYPKIGVQQHATLRQAVLDAFEAHGFASGEKPDRARPLPLFSDVQQTLTAIASEVGNAKARLAASVDAHISTMFVFNTFRASGRALKWADIVAAGGKTFILQLKGLEYALERAVTEFLLWNLIGFLESTGPSPLRIFVVLDEAHKLSFTVGSPTERLLREGRKFGIGLILASQQPSDFPPVAFNNTSTKIVFQSSDERRLLSRALHQKTNNSAGVGQVHRTITQLPPRDAYVLSQNVGRIIHVTPMAERIARWRGLS